MLNTPDRYIIVGGGLLVIAALAYVAVRGIKGAAGDIGGAAVTAVGGAIGGAVVTVGEAVGVPKTSLSECEKAKAEGRTWDASFACPAGDFLKYVFGG